MLGLVKGGGKTFNTPTLDAVIKLKNSSTRLLQKPHFVKGYLAC